MAKHQKNITAAKNRDIARFEQSEVVDDSLLPDAMEIEKLSHLDPDILNWLKSRAEKEQDFRHGAYNNRLGLVSDHNKRDHNTARFALLIYFFLVAPCIGFSYALVSNGHNLQGSIFGGSAFILALAVLVTRRKPKSPSETES